ncbi:MAG TPA: DUF1028 domain-containing protein [Solirubrobacteraceae bacterium]|nr:DUF1028 domain-containing protein [Solirubrobacteraceae bacterium]
MTYSIVARDPATGELGVAVQSHWFSAGGVVTWARPGIGAVATQANAEAGYGPQLLDLLVAGVPAEQALATLVANDPAGDSRQVAVVDGAGRVAAHTGSACMAYAGHATGAGVSCQANIMATERVWPAMLETFTAASGSLTGRLLDALDAAEREGGDLRGRQSAAILVVAPDAEPWQTVVSLRVEDHPDPLPELRRLVALHDAYALANEADELLNSGHHDEAARLYVEASQRAPGNHELMFWAGLGVAQAGDLDAGVAQVQAAIAIQPAWRELLRRLPPEMAPSAAAVLARVGDG